MTTYAALGTVYDDFRAVALGTNLSGRTSQSGHTWVVYEDTWTVQAAATGVLGTPDGNIAAGATADHSRCGIDFGSADVSVEATLWHRESTNYGAVMFRRTAAGYYIAKLAGAGGSNFGLFKVTDGDAFSSPPAVNTQIAVATVAWTDQTRAVVKVVCSGSNIDLYYNDVLTISTTDSTYDGTVHGLWQSFGGASNVTFFAFNMHPVTNAWRVGMVL